MKFRQLIKYDMGTFYLKNHLQNIVEKLKKSQNWLYLWINSLKFYLVSFYGVSKWGLSKYMETKLQTTCFYLTKEVWN